MNNQFDNELTFRLFNNDKADNPKRPDYKGEITIGGVQYKLSGWIAEVKNGQNAGSKYIRGKAERKDSAAAASFAAPPTQPKVAHVARLDDTEGVPF
jgi:hypothetical protein